MSMRPTTPTLCWIASSPACHGEAGFFGGCGCMVRSFAGVSGEVWLRHSGPQAGRCLGECHEARQRLDAAQPGAHFAVGLQVHIALGRAGDVAVQGHVGNRWRDRKSTRLNSSHSQISYAVFCLKKKKKNKRKAIK